MAGSSMSITACLNEISARLSAAAAIAKAAVACAEHGSEQDAVRIVLDLDVPLSEAQTLHGAVCLLGRLYRDQKSSSVRS